MDDPMAIKCTQKPIRIVSVVILIAWIIHSTLQILQLAMLPVRAGILGNTVFVAVDSAVVFLHFLPAFAGVITDYRSSLKLKRLTFGLSLVFVVLFGCRTLLYTGMIMLTMQGENLEDVCLDGPRGCRCRKDTVWEDVFETASNRTCDYGRNYIKLLIVWGVTCVVTWAALMLLTLITCKDSSSSLDDQNYPHFRTSATQVSLHPNMNTTDPHQPTTSKLAYEMEGLGSLASNITLPASSVVPVDRSFSQGSWL